QGDVRKVSTAGSARALRPQQIGDTKHPLSFDHSGPHVERLRSSSPPQRPLRSPDHCPGTRRGYGDPHLRPYVQEVFSRSRVVRKIIAVRETNCIRTTSPYVLRADLRYKPNKRSRPHGRLPKICSQSL